MFNVACGIVVFLNDAIVIPMFIVAFITRLFCLVLHFVVLLFGTTFLVPVFSIACNVAIALDITPHDNTITSN